MSNIKYSIIEDVETAKKIWDELSPHKTIDDEWEFRYTFIKFLDYKLHFIVAFDGEKPIALLPLQKSSLKGLLPSYYPNDGIEFLEFFGGDDTDDNDILGATDNHDFIFRELVWQIKERAYLAPLHSKFENFPNTLWYENKYYVNLENYKNHEDFLLATWGSSSRKKLLQQIRKIHREHKVEILENNYQDLDLLVEFNKNRFKESSSFNHEYRKRIFEDLINNYDILMQTIVVDGEKEAVSYGIKYKDAYIGMNAGVKGSIPDLPKYLVLLQIDTAINLGCKVYDAGKGDSGWKENFHFSKAPQFKIAVNAK